MSLTLIVGPSFHTLGIAEEEYIDTLYAGFLDELVNSHAQWSPNGTKVSCRRHDEMYGRHASFWHCVSGGSSDEELRILDHGRCARVHWIRPILDHFNSVYPDAGSGSINWWISSRNPRAPRYLIANSDFSYVVIVDERTDYALLVTAYCVEQKHRRRKLQREHEEYWSGK